MVARTLKFYHYYYNALLEVPSTQFLAQIYHMFPIRPKHVVKGNVWYICATNCVDGNHNKALSYTQYDAEV
jgi:hypothetical protein